MELNYIIIPLSIVFILFLGSFFTKKGMNWYENLHLPSFIPSDYFISISWLVITAFICASFLIIWNTILHQGIFWLIILILTINIFLNILRDYIFFFVLINISFVFIDLTFF